MKFVQVVVVVVVVNYQIVLFLSQKGSVPGLACEWMTQQLDCCANRAVTFKALTLSNRISA
ncbi:hypothetical protein BpHYR1_050251 [Brachionus plicatilis]|uniref:Uncharacterized protein n=1 Tax=Brachionus plicatilis TaxID=10195 RepID=A0A3M7RJI5_BRAPC|nr:hypothetical protein BpHYR1_050251 [Brachionus plicatilis]